MVAAVFGACLGSFLNVVIYRVPRSEEGLKVNKPARSFCPQCKEQLSWKDNIPLLSWIALRGKCRHCAASISAQYPLVELLSVLIWGLSFLLLPWAQALALSIFLTLLLLATIIDWKHMIIPHEVTIGGTILGLLCAVFLAPSLLEGLQGGAELGLGGSLLQLVVGALLGFALLFAVLQLGKVAFGKARREFVEAKSWKVYQSDEEEPPVFELEGEESLSWWDLFSRKSDRLRLYCSELEIVGETNKEGAGKERYQNTWLELSEDHLHVEAVGQQLSLERVDSLSGKAEQVEIPREAMGFGDVLFLMMIGSFIGWQGVLFTVFAASLLGAVIGLAAKWRSSAWGARIPFGPYLAVGAVLWLLIGRQFVAAYLGLF